MRSVEHSTIEAEAPAGRRLIAPHWYHLLGLSMLAVAADLLGAASGLQGGEPRMGWMRALGPAVGQISGDLFFILPVAAAVTAGLIRDRSIAAISGLKLAVVAMAVLLAVDLLPNAAPNSERSRLAVQGTGAISTPGIGATLGSVSGLRTLTAFVKGDLPGADEVLQRSSSAGADHGASEACAASFAPRVDWLRHRCRDVAFE